MKSVLSTKLILTLPILVLGAMMTGCAPEPPVEVHHYHTVHRSYRPTPGPSEMGVVNQYDRQSR